MLACRDLFIDTNDGFYFLMVGGNAKAHQTLGRRQAVVQVNFHIEILSLH